MATDASLSCMAGVEAQISKPLCSELCRTSLSRGRWTNLLSKGSEWERQHDLLLPEDEVEAPYSVHPLWELCSRCLEYREKWRTFVGKRCHINVLEAKAFLLHEKRIALRALPMKVPFALDSQVCLGMLVKRRSSAPALNRQLRSSLSYAIAGGVFGHYLYFPSACNRADGPTRDSEPAPPDMLAPAWLQLPCYDKFCEGLDDWLGEIDASFDCKLPFESLCKDDDVDLIPAARRRSPSPSKRKRELRKERQAKNRSSDDAQPQLDLAGSAGVDEVARIMERANEPSKLASMADMVENHAISGDVNYGPSEASENHLSGALRRLAARFPKRQFFFRDDCSDLTEPGGLDLYSGNFGVAKQMVKNGCPWVLTFEIKRSVSEDLLDADLECEIIEFIQLGVFLTLGLAPICASFSRAITPAVRSRRWPRGVPGVSGPMFVKLVQGNKHASFCLRCIDAAIIGGLIFWCEYPDKSFIWLQKGWKKWLSPSSPHVFRLAYCRFGTSWQKMTRVATNGILAGLRMLCRCARPHQRLRGYCHLHRCSWTSLAERYPRGFAKMLALNLCIGAGWCSREKLSVSGCARAGSLRIGEATNPGPRLPPQVRPSLHELHTLTSQTLTLEARVLQAFVDWCKLEFRESCDSIFDRCPEIFVDLLKVYGDLMFQERKALSNFRHLLLAAQRWKPLCRPYMASAWELISRWEAQEPVQHRVPIPEPLVRAMIVLSWLFGWRSWSCATAIAFYGGGRLGEILKCTRQDLLLPSDFLERGVSPVFLKLTQFKSRNRQPAKVQHLRIVEKTACEILHVALRRLAPEVSLFGGSPYQYRKRWNALLRSLLIPESVKVTPGGLRGGYAVCAYRSGESIQNIMWSLRLRSQVTLESYLQEAAALNCFSGLPAQSRDEINLLSDIFSFLPAAG